jgi:hypothetical protein
VRRLARDGVEVIGDLATAAAHRAGALSHRRGALPLEHEELELLRGVSIRRRSRSKPPGCSRSAPSRPSSSAS